jgi:murein DD-endopeptidase MepM/ murein hydrolase activator NlpD
MKALSILLLGASTLAADVEVWGGPGARGGGVGGARFTTFVTVSGGRGPGIASGTIEYRAGGVTVATEPFLLPQGGTLRREVPAETEGKGTLLIRVVADRPVSLWSETRNVTEAGSFGVSVKGFLASDSLSTGDVADFGGASGASDAASSRSNVGLLCLPDTQCAATVVVLGSDGVELGRGALMAAPNAAAQERLSNLVPAVAERETLGVRLEATAGRFQPYVVRNDNLSSDGVLLPPDIDRTHGSTLAFPLACRLGHDCWLINYYDRASSSADFVDYSGKSITYDGHYGTDYAINGFAAMDIGVDVLAAAEGTVTTVTDGFFDRCAGGCPASATNLVLVRHPDGSSTRYLHLKKRSILVKIGDQVARGQKLAEVGSSGRSGGPHLHLAWFRPDDLIQEGSASDPFVRPSDPYVTPWELQAPYHGFEATQLTRVVPTKQTSDILRWSIDPPLATSFERTDTAAIFVYAMRLIKGRNYRTRIVDASGAERVNQTLTPESDVTFGYFFVPFSVANGAAGEWTAEVDDGDRPLSRRAFTVN